LFLICVAVENMVRMAPGRNRISKMFFDDFMASQWLIANKYTSQLNLQLAAAAMEDR